MKINKNSFILASIIFVALVLRLFALFKANNLWLDELYSFQCISQHSILQTIKISITQSATPLYFILLKLFSSFFGSDSEFKLRLLSVLFGFLNIPAAFSLAKKFFNLKTAILSSIFIASSPVLVYYSIEVKYYSLTTFLAIVNSFAFLHFFKHNFSPKTIILYISSSICLLYSFLTSNIFIFFCAIYSLLFFSIIQHNHNAIKKLLLIYCAIFILYCPLLFFGILPTIISYSHAIANYNSIFKFDKFTILIFMQNFFSSQLISLLNNTFPKKINILSYIFLVITPIFISFISILKAFCSKNKYIYALLFPSLLFLSLEILLAKFHLLSVVTRHLILVLPLFFIIISFGLSIFRYKKLILIIFFSITSLNTFFIFYNHNIFFKQNNYDFYKKILYQLQVKPSDYIFVPDIGAYTLDFYLPKTNKIPFNTYDMVLNTNGLSNSLLFLNAYFSKSTASKLNNDNVKLIITSMIQRNDITLSYFNYLDQYFNKMKQGDKIFVILTHVKLFKKVSPNLYKNSQFIQKNLTLTIIKKVYLDSIYILNNKLHLINYIFLDKKDEFPTILVFEKRFI